MDPAGDVWAWLPVMATALGHFVFVAVVPVFCSLWGIARMREAAS